MEQLGKFLTWLEDSFAHVLAISGLAATVAMIVRSRWATIARLTHGPALTVIGFACFTISIGYQDSTVDVITYGVGATALLIAAGIELHRRVFMPVYERVLLVERMDEVIDRLDDLELTVEAHTQPSHGLEEVKADVGAIVERVTRMGCDERVQQ